jgi:3-phenylpropionate/trans-cinnamate dioxygenase ferredoxin subunit
MSDLVDVDVCAVEDIPSGSVKVVVHGDLAIAVFNADDAFYAIEDRCTHDDGPLAEGEFDPDACVVSCPRHGAEFDIRNGSALTLPAYVPVDTYAVEVHDGRIRVALPRP